LRTERERDGTAMLVVEQNLDFALRIADRWAVLKLGRIDDEGACGSDMRPRILQHLSL
jgi:branched-chain amino acid transport system ATP-binding protein